MFDALSERLQAALGDVRSRGKLTEDDISKAMRQVRLALLAPSITKRLIHEFAHARPGPAEPPKGMDELTARELEVFKLVARGLSNAEIAQELIVSETTVKTHVARVLMKLDLRDRVQAVVLAYESGVAVPGRTG